ncbi:hypothetical protein H9Q72_001199 [Fusarium xylarioides]|uniref:Uncharacterized protein n=1 Tax=Fusarium xylarioides TaxID=221167 RepID=A0A9P7LPG7_9HYPO|nr:hypothetical protein H9Q72_001199 [Fusarium xylarioides]KAG5817399.1 hypothetical protein H9Q71_001903 [Fusarium xylarioides]KAG5829284.1 hypothetical protein H9Q74_000680 [Fusarium xylarioides]
MTSSDDTSYLFPLLDVGPEDAGFRLQNEPDELQRKHVAQFQSSDITYQADLFAVVHGTIEPNGNHGVLIILDFQFYGSVAGERRFKHIKVAVAFGRKDKNIGDRHDPIVLQMAPDGPFRMDETKEGVETVVEGNASLSGGPSLATLGIGGSYQRTTTVDNTRYTTLNGQKWTNGRRYGKKNTAIWRINENPVSKDGVPPKLRAAILIEIPESCGPFKAELTVDAKVDVLYQAERILRSSRYIAPVYFDKQDGEWRNVGPSLADVAPDNLSGCNLSLIGTAKSPTLVES